MTNNISNSDNSLKDLFTFVPPSKLKQSILEVYFTWLIETPVLPQNYKEVTEDFYFLIKLLEKEEEKERK
jgi:hypothetical protein